MTDEEAIALVVRLVCRGRHIDPSQVSGSTDLVAELGFDSLDASELLTALHQETGRQLALESIHDVTTVSDIARGLVRAPDGQEVS